MQKQRDAQLYVLLTNEKNHRTVVVFIYLFIYLFIYYYVQYNHDKRVTRQHNNDCRLTISQYWYRKYRKYY